MYLEERRATIYDSKTKRSTRVENKSAAVLQTRHDRPDKLTAYSVRVYLKDQEQRLAGSYSTIIEPNGQMHTIDVSKPVGSRNRTNRSDPPASRCPADQGDSD